MLTYQDYLAAQDKTAFILQAIEDHQKSDIYKAAVDADLYDHQKNKTICNYVQMIFTLSGLPVEDFTASNNKICSNFFEAMNTQRCNYSLGNGITFSDHVVKTMDEKGVEVSTDETKEKLGKHFDTDIHTIGYYGLIHGLTFGFLHASGRIYNYKITEFVPLWDEETGSLMAGIRFWQIDSSKPMIVELYEIDGVTEYRVESNGKKPQLIQDKDKSSYIVVTAKAPAESKPRIISTTNYSALPVIPFWGSRLHQSTLIGFRERIDSYDLIRSGFANDLTDVSQIYFLIENYGGMTDEDLQRARDRLKLLHMLPVDTDNGGKITPYTQEIPHESRDAYLKGVRADMYEAFGALDVHTIAAGATNDHIDAAYQPMDDKADDYEFQMIEFIQQILKLQNIDDTPNFKRNRISNQKEQVEMVVSEVGANLLDQETAISKLPNVSPDEIPGIMSRLDVETNRLIDDTQGGNNE